MQFTEKDKFELMLVNAAGKPLVTSTGFAPDDSVAGEDYLEALASEKGEGHAVYRTAMGEKVMAVTTLLPRAAGEIVAVRFVTSLTLVDQSIAALVAFSLALVTAVVLFSVWTGMFFIRSIVRPIGEIELPPRRSPREIWTRVSKTNIMMRSASCPTPSTIWRASWTRPSA